MSNRVGPEPGAEADLENPSRPVGTETRIPAPSELRFPGSESLRHRPASAGGAAHPHPPLPPMRLSGAGAAQPSRNNSFIKEHREPKDSIIVSTKEASNNQEKTEKGLFDKGNLLRFNKGEAVA